MKFIHRRYPGHYDLWIGPFEVSWITPWGGDGHFGWMADWHPVRIWIVRNLRVTWGRWDED